MMDGYCWGCVRLLEEGDEPYQQSHGSVNHYTPAPLVSNRVRGNVRDVIVILILFCQVCLGAVVRLRQIGVGWGLWIGFIVVGCGVDGGAVDVVWWIGWVDFNSL